MIIKLGKLFIMKPSFIILLIVLKFNQFDLFSQDYLNLSVENDLYFGIDRYYSSGIFLSTGKLKNKEREKGDQQNNFIHWTLGQEIYTPSKRYIRDASIFDYPFGGWLFLERSFENYKKLNSSLHWAIKVGVTGNASLAPLLQNLYHDIILGLPDVTWEEALPQKILLNLSGMFRKRSEVTNQINFLHEYFGILGSQRISMGTRFCFLLGTSKALAFLGNPLDMQDKGYGIYLGTRQEYRFHDYMVSGSLFNDNAPFVLSSLPYKNSLEIGVAFYSKKWRIITIWNSISKDNQRQSTNRHYYLNISITRFLKN